MASIDIPDLPADLLKWKPSLDLMAQVCSRDFVVNLTDETSPHFDQTPDKVSLAFPKSAISKLAPVDFQLSDASSGGMTKINIYGGTVLDNNSSTLWTPTGLTLGTNTAFNVSGTDAVAYLIITYYETVSGGITSVTVDTAATLPDSVSGTYYLPLGTFSAGSSTVTVTTSPIGDQIFASGRQWYSNPASYIGIAGGI